jgi:proteasome lid subunit RPN8/RPN11
MPLTVTRGVLATLASESQSSHPHEACGLLLGKGRAITQAVATPNIALDPARHFEIDPAALVAAHKAERTGGMQIVGYWHSHPVGPPVPSATDQAHASGDGRVWAIVAGDAVGWFRDTPGGFVALHTPEISG